MDQVQEIKDRSDIVEIISTYLTLKRAGANFKANCPFHNEKSPSFMVSPERQTFKCFGCSEGGDVITFIEKMEGLDFYNALKLLADRAGIVLKNQSVKYGEKEHSSDQKTKIFEINEWAKKVYQKLFIDHPKAEKARSYIFGKRGMEKETADRFEIGYAPDSWDFILRYLRNKKYEDSEIVAAGLAIKSERGKVYDRFRGRVMFPINNAMGSTIAFTSRILEDSTDQAKYINSSESSIYIKGKTIYGLDKAKMAIKENDLAVLVEGNMDVIACHQAGYKNVVAVSGTALTEDQLKILSRYGRTIAFCFDMDSAGQTALKRAVRLAISNDISTKVISLPGGIKDPDEAIKKDKTIWEKSVKEAKSSMEYLIDKVAPPNQTLDIDQKKKAAKEILPVVKAISSDIEKEYYVKYLSERLGTSRDSLVKAIEKTKTDTEFRRNNKGDNLSTKETPKKSTILEKILALIWIEPTLQVEIKELADAKVDPPLLEYLTMIQSGKIDRDRLGQETKSALDQIAMEIIKELDTEEKEVLQSEYKYLVGRLRSQNNEQIKEDYAQKIKEAENRGDKKALKDLLLEFSKLIK